MAWTDERIDQLKRLWGQGMTASQIADELGGVSRNAVIGKAHRLGLEARPSPVKAGEAAAAAPAATAAPAAPPPERPTPAPVAAAPRPAPAPERTAPAAPVAAPATPTPAPAPQQMVRSIGPGGFQRQNPRRADRARSTPAPPRRLVPAKPSADMAGKTSLLESERPDLQMAARPSRRARFPFLRPADQSGLSLLPQPLLGRLSGAASAPRSPSPAAAALRWSAGSLTP
jgi:GcrA cell cycle regulator